MRTFNELRLITENDEPKMTPAQEKKREEIVLTLKKKKDEFKERYGSKWEQVMYATATKLAMEEQVISEAQDWGLIFDFTIEYSSREGRDIQKHLAKKFKKYWTGQGSGGSGFDMSFDGPKRELEKIKKYVEKEFGAVIDDKYTVLARVDESVKLEEMSAKAHYKKYQAKFVVPPIDRDRHPNREKEGLEGPYRSKKSGKIFYYDTKAGKYYDTETDMYLDVKDVMESVSVQLEEDEATQRFFKAVHAELKKEMDNKYYREFRASNDGRALDNVINHFGKSRGMRVDKTVKSIIDKYGKNRDEYIKKSFEMAANTKRGFREEVELDEASQRFGGDTNIPASKEITKYIESGKGIIIDVPSTLHPTSRFAIYKNPAKGSGQDKVLMATISNPKRGRVKMFSFHGTHVSHQKAMDFAKKHKLVTKKDAEGNPLYAKESVNESVWRTPEERHQTYHDMALDLITQIQGVDAVRKAVNDGKWIDSFGDKVGPKINLDLDADNPGTVEYQQGRGRGDWSFVLDTLKGDVKYVHKGKSGRFKNTVDFGKYIRSTNESVELDEVHANALGSPPGNIAGVSDNQPPKQKKFAGCALFDVDSDAYAKCINGRNKYERWERKLNMSNVGHSQIREYAHRNPGKHIIVRDSKTGAMSYLIHKGK